MTFGSLRKSVRRLYGGATPRGIRFRYALLAFNIATVLFIIATSFLPSFAERADARFAPSVAAARDDATAIKQSCDLSVGYDTRQLAGPRDEVDAIGTKGRRSAIASFKTPLHSGLAGPAGAYGRDDRRPTASAVELANQPVELLGALHEHE